MDKTQIDFLERLSNGFGPSGFEHEVLSLVKGEVTSYAESITQDRMGSLMFSARGSADRPVILIPGHVDEVGFIISGINDKGYLTFATLGGWFDQVLLGQRVIVRTRTGDRQGVIAAKPPHVMPPEERKKIVTKDSMFIDLGCSNKKEAEYLGVRIGDPVVPYSNFSTLEKTVIDADAAAATADGPGVDSPSDRKTMTLAIGKAFDDRIGAFIAAETVKRLIEEKIDHPNTVIGAATVQEEVGTRGATTAGWVTEPDVVITLEVDISGDVPGIEPHKAPAAMGKGPSLLTFDASMIPNPRLKELVIDTAEEESIPLQLSMLPGGGTDAGPIHKLRGGCPGVVVGIPTRHIHSHVGILSLSDVELCVDLLVAIIKRLDAATVAGLTAI